MERTRAPVPSSIIEPIWDQFAALPRNHLAPRPRGCHRRRIPDRLVFDKLVQVLIFGRAYALIAAGSWLGSWQRCTLRRWVPTTT